MGGRPTPLLIWFTEKERQARKQSSGGTGENIELSESALSSAETYFQLGENIDTVCAMVEPKYADWSLERRGEYREWLLKSIQDRRGKREESATA